MSSAFSIQTKSSVRTRKGGFALIITITLLAFLVLLLVSLASLTRVETQVAGNSQQLAQARQNALMALNIALGQLQKTAGPDQRSTATADLAGIAAGARAPNGAAPVNTSSVNNVSNGLTAVRPGTRYWTGVWGNSDAPESVFTKTNGPVLLNWLVSGNESATFNSTPANGQITASNGGTGTTAPVYNPALVVSGLSTNTGAAALATASITVNGSAKEAKILVGPNTVGATAADTDKYVVAPLVDITSTGVPGQAVGTAVTVGRYAWWVGDEGVKAKYNLADPYVGEVNTANPGNTAGSRYRILAAQRNGIETMTGFSSGSTSYYPTNSNGTAATNSLLSKALNLGAIPLVAALPSPTTVPNLWHEITTSSYGVLADSQFGGLRRDLTYYFDPASTDTYLDGRNILPDAGTSALYTAPFNKPSPFSDTTGNGGYGYNNSAVAAHTVSPRLGPKWDVLKSFYRTQASAAGVEVQPAIDLTVSPPKVQNPIVPVVLESRVMFGVTPNPLTIHTSVIFIIGNPYTFPIKATNGLDLKFALAKNNWTNATNPQGEEQGLILNQIEPDPARPNTDTNHYGILTQAFTRIMPRQGSSARSGPVGPAPFATVSPSGGSTCTTTPTANVFYLHHYPILKQPEYTRSGSQNDNAPSVLDDVIFRTPANTVIPAGQTLAYTIAVNQTATTGTETVINLAAFDGTRPTASTGYFSHRCAPSLVNPGFTVSADANTYYQASICDTGTQSGNSGAPCMGVKIAAAPASPAGSPNFDAESLLATVDFSDPGGYSTYANSSSVTKSGTTIIAAFPNYAPSTYLTAPLNSSTPNPVKAFRLTLRPGKNSGYASYGESNIKAAWFSRTAPLNTFSAGYFTPTATNMRSNLLQQAEQGAWGNGDNGSPTYASITATTANRLPLFDLPSATGTEIPLLSIGQFQHADVTADDESITSASESPLSIGNSTYNRLVLSTGSASAPFTNTRSRFRSINNTDPGDTPAYPGYIGNLSVNTPIRYYDKNYLVNASLWDSNFLSTIPQANAASPLVPANGRIHLISPATTLAEAKGSSLTGAAKGRAAASKLLVDGAFNVNSTSVQAWKALLSGMRNLAVNNVSVAGDTPFPRSINQSANLLADPSSLSLTLRATYTGFRALTDQQITDLATTIVTQVRTRGPFLSLSQFINRSLASATDDRSLAGPLQRAIDTTPTKTPAGTDVTGFNSAIITAYPLGLSAASTDTTLNPQGDPNAVPGNVPGQSKFAGIPGWLTQADILQSIGSALSSRSDTFVIRAYGEVLDPVNSTATTSVVTGRAWCEAVVQRLPDYVNPADDATVLPLAASPVNQAFGRRFRVVSFRWLSPNDI